MIKGCNHHVMPYDSGWCVMSEMNHRIIAHFDTQEKALGYAAQCAREREGSVLLHTTAIECSFDSESESSPTLSTVTLPQQDSLPDFAHQQDLDIPAGELQAWDAGERPKVEVKGSDFDPLLGFDEYYFEI